MKDPATNTQPCTPTSTVTPETVVMIRKPDGKLRIAKLGEVIAEMRETGVAPYSRRTQGVDTGVRVGHRTGDK